MIFILAFKKWTKENCSGRILRLQRITRDEVPLTFSRPGITNLYILSFSFFFWNSLPFLTHLFLLFARPPPNLTISPKVSKDKNSHAHLSLDGNSCSLSSYFLVPFTIFLSRHHAAKRRLYFTCCLHLIFFHKQVHFSSRYAFQHLQLFLHGRSELVDSFLFQSQFAFFPPLPLLLCSLLVQAALSEFSLK